MPEMYFSEKQDSSDDETIYEISRDLSNNELSLNINETADDKTWLSRAMSLCSEGDDIETLASEAGCIPNNVKDHILDDDIIKPDNQPSQGSVDMLPTLLESDNEGEDEQDVFVEIISPRNISDSENNSPRNSEEITSPGKLENSEEVSGSCLKEKMDFSLSQPLDSQSISSGQDSVDNDTEYITIDKDLVSSTMKLDNRRGGEDNETTNKEDDCAVNKTEASSTGGTKPAHRQVSRAVSNIAVSWIDPKKKDYLYQAAQIIQQALYCEANEMYEDAFNKYKICVGILLNGVQRKFNFLSF